MTTRVLLIALCAVLSLFGCGTPVAPTGGTPVYKTRGIDGPGSLQRAAMAVPATVENLPKSRIGNRSTYTVFGVQYRVMDTAINFKERGVASWYGAKFHGRDTSSGEVYDMYAMTAAHKHLPLPTFVQVTHLETGKSIVVKVNDRGPFVDDRIIDLSYAAAYQLGMLDTGTAPVEIVAISTNPPKSNNVVAETPLAVPNQTHYIQLGAFKHQPNAELLKLKVADSLPLPTRIQHDVERALYRVRVGPVENQSILSETLTALAAVGVNQYKLIQSDR